MLWKSWPGSARDPIPEWVLTGDATRSLAAEALSGGDVVLALAELERYSLLKREVTAERSAPLVHRLVQGITRWRLAASVRHLRLERAPQLVTASAVGNPQDIRTWPVWVPLWPHVRALVEYGEQAGIHQPTASLMAALGLFLVTKALHAEAEPFETRGPGPARGLLRADHPDVALRLNNLAQLLQDTNRLAEAVLLIREGGRQYLA